MSLRNTLSALVLGAGLLYGSMAYAGEPKVVGETYSSECPTCPTAAPVAEVKKKPARKSCADRFSGYGMCLQESVAESLGVTESRSGDCPGNSNTKCYNTEGIPNLREQLDDLGTEVDDLADGLYSPSEMEKFALFIVGAPCQDEFNTLQSYNHSAREAETAMNTAEQNLSDYTQKQAVPDASPAPVMPAPAESETSLPPDANLPESAVPAPGSASEESPAPAPAPAADANGEVAPPAPEEPKKDEQLEQLTAEVERTKNAYDGALIHANDYLAGVKEKGCIPELEEKLKRELRGVESGLGYNTGRVNALEAEHQTTVEVGASAVYSPKTNTFGAEAEVRVLGGNTVRAGMYANGSYLKEEQTSVKTEQVIPGLNQTTTETVINQRVAGAGAVAQVDLGAGFNLQGKAGAAYNLRELERNILVGEDSIDVGRKENRVVGEAAVGVNFNVVGPFGIGVEARGNTDKNYSVEGGLYLTF